MTSEVKPDVEPPPCIMIDEHTGSFTILYDMHTYSKEPDQLLNIIHQSLLGAAKYDNVSPVLPINKLEIVFDILSKHTTHENEYCACAYVNNLNELRDFFKSTVDKFKKTIDIISSQYGLVTDSEGKVFLANSLGTKIFRSVMQLISNVDEHKEESDEND